MPNDQKSFPNLSKRCQELGLTPPKCCCILPRRFETAKSADELCHESAALDLKVLFRKANLPITIYQPDGQAIPYLQENDITWTGPMLLFTAAELTNNSELLNVAIGVISNYVTGLFKGSAEPTRARLSVVIEKTASTNPSKKPKSKKQQKKIMKEKTMIRVDYDGPPEKMLSEIIKMIKDASK